MIGAAWKAEGGAVRDERDRYGARIISFVVGGEPKPQARPRFSRQGGRAYTPSKTRKAAETLTARVAALGVVGEPLTCPLELEVLFELPIPESWPKWKQQAARERRYLPTGKPDTDNLLKMLKDACNGVVWKDDAQVFRADATKLYSDNPKTTVRLILREQATRAA